MTTILVTGFGSFPGAPFNPTTPLVRRLARLRRPAWAEVTLVPHVFPTSYAAVDRDLAKLIARHRPDALLMFGLAPRAKTIHVETRARNAASILPDAGGAAPRSHSVEAGAPGRAGAAGTGASPAWGAAGRTRAGRAVARCGRLPLQLSRLASGRIGAPAARAPAGCLHPCAQYPPPRAAARGKKTPRA